MSTILEKIAAIESEVCNYRGYNFFIEKLQLFKGLSET